MRTFSISELAEEAGVTPRTIRFYTAEGLLPPPDTRGRYARYTEEHLQRLSVIQQLKEAFLPLHVIREELERLGRMEEATPLADEESALFDTMPSPSIPPAHGLGDRLRESASDYIRRITGQAASDPNTPAAPPAAVSLPRGPLSSIGRSARRTGRANQQWERIALNDEVELHARVPRSPESQKLIERLLDESDKHHNP